MDEVIEGYECKMIDYDDTNKSNKMESQEFKKEFCAMAKKYGFKTAYGCCYKESAECLFVLELQRS